VVAVLGKRMLRLWRRCILAAAVVVVVAVEDADADGEYVGCYGGGGEEKMTSSQQIVGVLRDTRPNV
jgi:hypothetical protein